MHEAEGEQRSRGQRNESLHNAIVANWRRLDDSLDFSVLRFIGVVGSASGRPRRHVCSNSGTAAASLRFAPWKNDLFGSDLTVPAAAGDPDAGGESRRQRVDSYGSGETMPPPTVRLRGRFSAGVDHGAHSRCAPAMPQLRWSAAIGSAGEPGRVRPVSSVITITKSSPQAFEAPSPPIRRRCPEWLVVDAISHCRTDQIRRRRDRKGQRRRARFATLRTGAAAGRPLIRAGLDRRRCCGSDWIERGKMPGAIAAQLGPAQCAQRKQSLKPPEGEMAQRPADAE